jgi:hypothetical protein
MDDDDSYLDERVAAVSPTVRDELLKALLVLAERFNREHNLELDLPGRMILIDTVLADYADAMTPPETIN